jgi:membrane glycosyltransferase
LLGLLREGEHWQQHRRDDQSFQHDDAVQQAGRSMQAGAALAHGVSQQAFKHAAGFLVAGVMSARVAPIGEIPIEGAGFGD